MLEEERPLDARAEELVELARESFGELTEGRRIAGLHALRARLSSRQRIRSVRNAVLGVTGALALAVCVVKLLGGREATQSRAELYLRRFPKGTYAAAARTGTSPP